uniref:Uncharacterized protein n=1 Tax=Cacopsylla melanoneura TaxID=428564 RepID=A0A8D9F761_9HEMI
MEKNRNQINWALQIQVGNTYLMFQKRRVSVSHTCFLIQPECVPSSPGRLCQGIYLITEDRSSVSPSPVADSANSANLHTIIFIICALPILLTLEYFNPSKLQAEGSTPNFLEQEAR